MSILEKEAEPNPYYSCPDEQYIAEEAAQMAGDILYDRIEKKGHWQDKLKTRVMKLLWQTHLKSVVPPYDLVILIGLLFGDRHDWPFAKFSVIEELAKNYNPPKDGKIVSRGAKSFAARILEEEGGILARPRPLNVEEGNIKRNYRATIDKWFEDPIFLYLWSHKRRVHLNRHGDFSYITDKNLAAIIESCLSPDK